MEEAIATLGRSLGHFCNHLQSSVDALNQSIDRRPIPLDSASSTFVQCLNRCVSTVSGDLELLDSMSFGTVSFEELLVHCNEAFKKNQSDLAQLEERLTSFGYVPEIGQRCLEELRSRSFFDVVEEEYPILTFRIHDLIYELDISVAQTESSNMKMWTQDISPTTRHMSFPNPSRVPKDELSRRLGKLSHVRTIICEGLGSSDSEEFFLETCISRFKHLRVLGLSESSFDLLLSSIGGLKHLRFLSLSDNHNFKKLPESVYKLRNLQYLNLCGCEGLEELSADIKNMISLRVLFITTKQQRFPERGIGCLTSLRWLFMDECENLEALFDDIQSLTSLRKLYIWSCPKLASLPQGIKNLKALEDLMICDCESLRLPEGESNEPRSMSRLQSFTIMDSPEIVSLPGWLEGSASTLQKIIVHDCPKLSVLPEWLRNCSSLRTLEIEDCSGLSSLPDGVCRIPTLTKLRISGCGELSSCGEEEEDDQN